MINFNESSVFILFFKSKAHKVCSRRADAKAYNITALRVHGVSTEYPATIVLDLTAHFFLKNDECARINYGQLRGIL